MRLFLFLLLYKCSAGVFVVGFKEDLDAFGYDMNSSMNVELLLV